MDLKKAIGIVLKRLWLVIVMFVVVVAVSLYVNLFVLVPIYQAHTTLLITGMMNQDSDTFDNVSLENIAIGRSLISEYSEIIKSKRVTDAVLEDLNDSTITEEDLNGMVSISAVNDTRIIDIAVINEDPVKAARIADSVAAAFSEQISALYNAQNINVIDKAEIPNSPIAPTKKKNIAMAGAAAIVVSLGIIFLMEFLDNTIKTSEDVENYLGLSVIGSIPLDKSDGRKDK